MCAIQGHLIWFIFVFLCRLMAIPANVMYFSLYDHLKYKFGFREDDPSTAYRSVLAGISARSMY